MNDFMMRDTSVVANDLNDKLSDIPDRALTPL